MHRINAAITIVLAGVAVAMWSYVCYNAVTVQTQAAYSLHAYPALLAVVLTACACLGWTLVARSAERGDEETRCRKCLHILRGLSEPRCPECGTPI